MTSVVVYLVNFPEYTVLGGDEELPLGEEFQALVKCFINPNEKKTAKKYEWAAKLIEQLKYVFPDGCLSK